MLGNSTFLPAHWVRCPRLRNIETQGHGNRNVVAGEGQRHKALTVGLLSQRATILVRNADRMLSLLRKGRVINNEESTVAPDEGVGLC